MVQIYLQPPAKFETVAILNSNSKNAFASDQSLVDSTILRLKKEAAKLGANGVLLSGIENQQIGSIGNWTGNTSGFSTGMATAHSYGNTTTAYGNGTTDTFNNGMMVNTPIFTKAATGTAIYVK